MYPARISLVTGAVGTLMMISKSFHSELSSSCRPDGLINIVTYNVLSDALVSPDFYVLCNPVDCNNSIRLQRVQKKLQAEMDRGSVICLQEVSRKWGGNLVSFFEANGYSYVSSDCGSIHNGYMGPCLAWPQKQFALVDADVTRIGDTIPWQVPKRIAPAPGLWTRLLAFCGLMKIPPNPSFDPWEEARRRSNTAILARLRQTATGKQFVVGTYHMPCLFGSDEKCQVMAAHAALLMQVDSRYIGI
jgi:2',5'-phosphodiesterase